MHTTSRFALVCVSLCCASCLAACADVDPLRQVIGDDTGGGGNADSIEGLDVSGDLGRGDDVIGEDRGRDDVAGGDTGSAEDAPSGDVRSRDLDPGDAAAPDSGADMVRADDAQHDSSVFDAAGSDADALEADAARDVGGAEDLDDGEVFESGTLEIFTIPPSCLPEGSSADLQLESFGAGDGAVWSARNLPPGVGITASGQLTGTYDEAGEYLVTVRVEATDGRFGQRRYTLSIVPRLTVDLGGRDYIDGNRAGVDVLAEAGIEADDDTRCNFYLGAGGGVLPPGVSQSSADASGCTLVGDASAAEVPGVYGVMVQVDGACRQSVLVPVRYLAGSCNSGVAGVDPPASDHVRAAGSAYSRRYFINDIDGCTPTAEGCDCTACVTQSVGAFPLPLNEDLSCAGAAACLSSCAGDVCFSGPATCDDSYGYERTFVTQAHTPLAPAGSTGAWISYDIRVVYSGENRELETCGDKVFACHIDVLER